MLAARGIYLVKQRMCAGLKSEQLVTCTLVEHLVLVLGGSIWYVVGRFAVTPRGLKIV